MKLSKAQYDQLAQGEWVLAVNNYWRWHYEHLFSLLIKAFQFIILTGEARKRWPFQHSARIVDGVVYEMLKDGKVGTPLTEWLAKRRRCVGAFKAHAPFVPTLNRPYDFYGIPQVTLSRTRKRLGIGNTWNGLDGVNEKKIGDFCSEETALACGRTVREAANLLPAELYTVSWLTHQFDFET